jgi:hypothetical protein
VFSLQRVPGAWPDVSLPPGWPSGLDFSVPATTVDEPRLAADDPARRLDLRGAIARLGELYAASRDGAATAAVNFFVSWLESHPEAAAEILRDMRSRTYPEQLSAVTFFCMSKVRDPRVRDAMIRAAQDEGQPTGQRFRAVVALGDSVTADRDTVAALQGVHALRRPGDDEARESLTDGALYAIGTVASRGSGDVAAAAHEVIRATLASAREPEERVDALNAAGNSHDRRYRPEAEAALSDSSARVRAAGAHTLGAVRDPEAEAALRARLSVETVKEVLMEILGALHFIARRPAPETVGVAVSRLPSIEDVEVRVALVQLIGAATDTNREARAALRAWFHQERDGRVLSAIGRYLRADELGTP